MFNFFTDQEKKTEKILSFYVELIQNWGGTLSPLDNFILSEVFLYEIDNYIYIHASMCYINL